MACVLQTLLIPDLGEKGRRGWEVGGTGTQIWPTVLRGREGSKSYDLSTCHTALPSHWLQKSVNHYSTLSPSSYKKIQTPGSNLVLRFNCTINIIFTF